MSMDALRKIGKSRVWRGLVAFMKWLVRTWWHIWVISEWR